MPEDPALGEKVRGIAGPCPKPPGHARLLCADEQSQSQSLERKQPLLPLGLGHVEGVTHDHVRHGTRALSAALDVANGPGAARVREPHRQPQFLDFLRPFDRQTPPHSDPPLIVDNQALYKHGQVNCWAPGQQPCLWRRGCHLAAPT